MSASGTVLAQPAPLSPAVQQGVAWLNAQVQADGSLSEESTSIATPFQARATAVAALSVLDSAPPALASKVAAASDANSEYIARRVIAAATTQQSTSTNVASLLGMQSADGGWGLTASYAGDPLDTAFTLRALHAANPAASMSVANALGFLGHAKNSDGGWGINGQSSVYATANVLLASSAWSDHYTTGIASSASAWLLDARTGANDFGDTFDNGYGLLALATQSAQRNARAPLIAALQGAQLADGSWADDPYLTALALRALYAASLPSPDQIAVKGHVIDGQSGALFSGVNVSLTGPQTYTQTTDANGDFVFPNVVAGAYTLMLAHSGYGTVTATTLASAGQTLDFGTIALLADASSGGPTTGTVQGTVTDAATHAPIAGASVSAAGVSVDTAVDGSYEIANLAPGSVTISASAPGYQTVSGTGSLVAGGIALFSPQLRAGSSGTTPAATLLGVVTDATTGQPIAGASVAVTGDDSATTQTDATGSYQIDDLAPGAVQIVVSANGYDSVGASTQLQDNTAVTFSPTLYPTGTSPTGANTSGVSGTVVDSTTGKPLADVTIVATAPDTTTQTITTDASGRFTVAGLTQAEESLDFSLDDYVSTQFSTLIVPLQTVDIGQVRLRPTGVLKLLPDLIVKSVDSKTQANSDPQTFALSGNVQAVVANHGSGQVPAGVQVLAFYDANSNGAYDPATDTLLGKAATIAALDPQTTQTVSVPVSGTLPFRDAPVTVWVDSTQTVIELDETNNTGSSTSQCKLAAPPSTVEPALKWAWDGGSVFGPVVVGHLTDDNGDGRYDSLDIPTLVFTTTGGSLVAVSGKDGHELWRRNDLDVTGYGSATLADIDSDGRWEVLVVNHNRTKLYALRDDGTLMWSTAAGPAHTWYEDVYGGIAVADLDQDGNPEIILSNHVYSNTGKLLWAGKGDQAGYNTGDVPIAADIDPGSQGMEVLAGRTLYSATGDILWNRSDISCDGFNGVGDFGYPNPPQIVLVSCGSIYLLDRDGTTIWKTAVAGGGRGGPPTIGDFGGEGKPQIGVAGAGDYGVYGADGSIRWTATTHDYSSNMTGSSAFDFLDNGRVEILYADENKLRVYDGANGDVLWETKNGSLTTYEYPVVADVDGDGHADLVTGANSGTPHGVRVFSAATGGWAPTRTVWNEHAYHVTNINDDGSVPRVEPDSWTHGNTYRLNAFLGHGALDGPDLTAGRLQIIDNGTGQPLTLQARIGNGGQIASKPTAVAFYNGDPANGGSLIGSVTLGAVAAGQYQDVTLPGIAGLAGTQDVYVDVDPANLVEECDKTNNIDHVPYVAGNVLAQLQVGTDASSYGPNNPVLLSGTAKNAGSFAVDYSLDLRVEDTGGSVVIDFGDRTLGSVEAGDYAADLQLWNTGTTLAGPYVLHGLLYAADGSLLTEARAPFSITADRLALTSTLGTDRRTYAPTDHVMIASRVTNTSANTILSNLTLKISVTDPSQATVYTTSYPIAQLLNGASKPFTSIEPLQQAATGTYQVTQTVSDVGGSVLNTEHATYDVASTAVTGAGIDGTLVAHPHRIAAGTPVTLTATASNTGNSALHGVPLTVRVLGMSSGQSLWTQTSSEDIAQNANVALQPTWPSAGVAPGHEAAVLSVNIGGKDLLLAQDTLEVIAAPSISAAFADTSLAVNGTTSLTLSLSNPNVTTPLNAMHLTASLPAGLAIATPNHVRGTCLGAGATVTANAGTEAIGITDLTLSGSATSPSGANVCTLSVDITATTGGDKMLSGTPVSATFDNGDGGTGNISGNAPTATITVKATSTPATPVPGLGRWALLILALGLLVIAAWQRRRSVDRAQISYF